MYYNINKVPNDAKKYNIKIAERGFGQTYYLRQKYLLQLGFNINSIGFDYWIRAIEVYKPNVKMENVYFTLAQFFGKKPTLIERGMRTASERAKEKIKEYYKYDGKLSNKSILNLLTNFGMKGE